MPLRCWLRIVLLLACLATVSPCAAQYGASDAAGAAAPRYEPRQSGNAISGLPESNAAVPRSPEPASRDAVIPASYSASAGAVRTAPAPAAATPLAPTASSGVPSLTLAPPARGKSASAAKSYEGLGPLISTFGSLAAVVGLFLVIAWVLRRGGTRGSLILPGEVFEVLGRAPLTGRQQVHLLRCGSKLLLVSVTPGGAETLTEVTEPAEVDRLAGLCRQAHPNSATAAFRQVFQQFAPRNPRRASTLDSLGRKDARKDRDAV
jgi:flagellar protein FliO/FliZ